MFKAKFKIKHKNCWTCGLNNFKSQFITHITVNLNENFVQDITEIDLFDQTESKLIKSYFSHHPFIKKFEILEETPQKIIVQIFTDTTKITSIVHTILQHKCFIARSVFLVDGFEIWTIAAPKKHLLNRALNEVEKLGKFTLLSIKKTTFDGFDLSYKQEKILKLAVSNGYYSWPRKMPLQKLAQNLKISPSALSESLRKAELKVFSQLFLD